jgi:DNA-binding IscR family transcriptional regulator
MGQDVIYDFMADHPYQWFSVNEVALRTGLTKNNVSEGFRRMRKTNIIYSKKGMRPAGVGRAKGMREVLIYKFKRCH